MNHPGLLQTDEVLAAVKSVDEWMTRDRREVYDRQQSREPQKETFEEYLEGFLVRLSPPATEEEMRELESLTGISLPPELRELYGSLGGLVRSVAVPLSLFPVSELLRRLRLPSGWERFRSLGLVDMMIASWFNERPELEPGWLLEADEIERLNAAYTCIAWILCGDGESFRYVYFDRDGTFGLFRAHQDELDEVYKEHLLPMQSRSPADRTLSSIVIGHLRGVARALESLDAEG